ncbi:hypothetical protein [Streptomyces sp. NPDC093097]|uniref:hypothetical protein n=1 Tax=Streptomyces sp. NPDC093097 TaxID=3366027 RepID=UPI003828DB01
MSNDSGRWSERQLWDAWAEHYDANLLGTADPSSAETAGSTDTVSAAPTSRPS